MRQRSLRRGAALAAALLMAFVAVPGVYAADGEIGDVGDTDSITDLKVDAGGHVYAKVDYVHDCPPGMSCSIEVNFGYQCPEAYCFDYTYQGWKPLPAPASGVSTVFALCNGAPNDDNRWQILYRIHWWAPQRITTTISGEYESFIKADGTAAVKLIGEAGLNVSTGGGLKTSQVIETTTATNGYTPDGGVIVATSKGLVYHNC